MLRLLLLALAWGIAALPAAAQDVLPVPALSARVIDQTGTLEPAQREQLEARLAAFEQSKGTQIVVLLVPSTQPEDIAAYAQRVADSWKIGRRDIGDGLLIVVAKNDRRIRIEVAKTLEGAVPDLAARQIIDRQIAPAFKSGDFAGGLEAGVAALIARIDSEGLPQPQAGQRGPPPAALGTSWDELAMFFFIAVFVVGGILTQVLGRKLAMVLTGGGAGVAAWALGAGLGAAVVAALLALIMVGALSLRRLARQASRRGGGWGRWPPGGISGGPGGGWGGGGGFGGGGFGGGGGGFGSGGGGDFGGGGASGDW